MTIIHENTTGDRLLKLREVMNRTSLGSSTIYRRMDAGTFPKPRQLSQSCVRWLESDINRWMSELPVVSAVHR